VFAVRYELGSCIPDNGILPSHRHENLKSYIIIILMLSYEKKIQCQSMCVTLLCVILIGLVKCSKSFNSPLFYVQ
jgi:hypothetical protein